MRYTGDRQACLWLVVASLATGVTLAENVDPNDDQSQYAWSENAGWINAEPSGPEGIGLEVADFELSGWMWGENIGWISLSCASTASCSTGDYRVVNDGGGMLSGYAWAENAGWIDFAPSTAGVSIDPASGDFSGRAWGENVGWISFASAGPHPYKVTTAWSCVPAPGAPSGPVTLTLNKSGSDVSMSWNGPGDATGFDVLLGDLGALRDTGGDFSQATTTERCLDDNRTTSTLQLSGTSAEGAGSWVLVRGVNCAEAIDGSHGTYDSYGTRQIGLRDAEVSASGHDCP